MSEEMVHLQVLTIAISVLLDGIKTILPTLSIVSLIAVMDLKQATKSETIIIMLMVTDVKQIEALSKMDGCVKTGAPPLQMIELSEILAFIKTILTIQSTELLIVETDLKQAMRNEMMVTIIMKTDARQIDHL